VPRPDLSAKLGTPNACADCHADRDASWAAAALAHWHGSAAGERPHFAEALAAGRLGTAGAVGQLRAVIEDKTQPPVARASALDLLARYPGDLAAETIRRSLSDADPLVRYQALRGLPPGPPAQLARLLSPSLEDAARANRHEAARRLTQARVDLPAAGAAPAAAKLTAELADLERSLRHDLSRGEAWVNLANVQADRGDLVAAEASLRSAIRLESSFIPTWANLADLLRSAGRETEVESLLREALAQNKGAPALHESLGLSLVRQGRKAAALREFAAAYGAAPEMPRFRYVYALALHDAGRGAEARRLLAQGLALRFDRDLALALAAFAREAGDSDASAKVLAQWRAVNPGDPALLGVAE
jgi:tetratricopeptide (TPR) repeat protein